MGLCLVDADILALCSASRLKWAKANDAWFTRYAMKLQNEPNSLSLKPSSLHLGNQRTRLPQQFTELPSLSNGFTGIDTMLPCVLVAARSA